MNDRAKIVLWLGLFMILFQVVKDWAIIKAVLFTGSGANTGIPLIVPGTPPTVPGGEPSGEGEGGAPTIPPAELPPADVPPALSPKVVPGEILPPDIPAILASSMRTT